MVREMSHVRDPSNKLKEWAIAYDWKNNAKVSQVSSLKQKYFVSASDGIRYRFGSNNF